MTISKSAQLAKQTKSAGWSERMKKKAAAMGDRSTTHGQSTASEYSTWGGIKTRCLNPNSVHYKFYVGRGITICNRWRDSFEAFLDDVGKRPFPRAQLDRINNDGNYEPGNCRWTTAKVNIHNSRRVLRIEIDGETKSLTEWLAFYKLGESTYKQRKRRGYTIVEALTTPVGDWLPGRPKGRPRKS